MANIKRDVADEIDMLYNFINSFYTEVKDLSKKKPNDLLNDLKVKKINKVLNRLSEVLKDEPHIKFLDPLDSENIPSNSDAAMILNQYISALDDFKNKRTDRFNDWVYD